jgi:hypothetical protein
MELLRSEIPEEYESKETMWIYKENKDLFNKYSQIKLQEIPQESPQLPTIIITTPSLPPPSLTKTKKDTPLELIIKYTACSDKMKQEIKQKLIELITIPEFSKAFGVKKSAEIVSAITRDAWNQSIALFVSFLLDSSVVYKEKSYLFNKDKNTKEIIVMS